MATVSKSSKTKVKKVASQNEAGHDESESESELLPSKTKKPIEVDEPESAGGIEEKLEEDPLAAATEEESEESSLDGEELNPFGDRWEE